MKRLDEIKGRLHGITPGKWKLWGMQVMADPVGNSSLDDALLIANTADPHRGLRTFNASFIAEAPTDIAVLTTAIEDVLALHMKAHKLVEPWASGYKYSGWHCVHDGSAWPCPTVNSIEDALDSQP